MAWRFSFRQNCMVECPTTASERNLEDDNSAYWKESNSFKKVSNYYDFDEGYTPPYGNYTYGRYETPKPTKPFENLDRKKWPRTFNQLVLFYYSPDWWSMTKWVPDVRVEKAPRLQAEKEPEGEKDDRYEYNQRFPRGY